VRRLAVLATLAVLSGCPPSPVDDLDASLDQADATAPGDAAPDEAGRPDFGIDAGTCTATCGGGCTDTTTDPRHCGRCGHDCELGRCENGFCQPYPLLGDPRHATGLKSLYGLTVAGGNLYGTDWYQTQSGLVYTVPTSSAAAPYPTRYIVPIGMSDGSATTITTDGQHLFYSIYRNVGAGVWSCDFDGGNNQRILSGGGYGRMAADDQYVYVQAGNLCRIEKNGMNELCYPADAPPPIVGGDGFIYFALHGTPVRATPDQLDQPTNLAGSVGTIVSLALGGSAVYFLDSGNRVYSVPRSGAAAFKEITPPGGLVADQDVTSLFADQQRLYFIAFTRGFSGVIFLLDTNGQAPPTLVAEIGDGISDMTQDDRAIYYTTYGIDEYEPPFSAVWKLIK
jgi:hypothetical protein